MKYIKTYESKYRYLNDADTNKLALFVDDYIKKQNLPEKISKLKFDYFEDKSFNYIDIFEELISSGKYGDSNNIYYKSDEFCEKNNISTSVENRNSLSKLIFNKYFKKYIKYFDNRVIELIKRRVKRYEEIYDEYEMELSTKVKNAFQYILDAKKYNM